jgi:hypothetical protein
VRTEKVSPCLAKDCSNSECCTAIAYCDINSPCNGVFLNAARNDNMEPCAKGECTFDECCVGTREAFGAKAAAPNLELQWMTDVEDGSVSFDILSTVAETTKVCFGIGLLEAKNGWESPHKQKENKQNVTLSQLNKIDVVCADFSDDSIVLVDDATVGWREEFATTKIIVDALPNVVNVESEREGGNARFRFTRQLATGDMRNHNLLGHGGKFRCYWMIDAVEPHGKNVQKEVQWGMFDCTFDPPEKRARTVAEQRTALDCNGESPCGIKVGACSVSAQGVAYCANLPSTVGEGVLSIIIGFVGLLFLVYLLLRFFFRKKEGGLPPFKDELLKVLSALLTLFDVFTDILFIVVIYTVEDGRFRVLSYISIASIVVPFLLNSLTMIVTLRGAEMLHFWAFFKNHMWSTAAVMLLATLNLSLFNILSSKLLGQRAFRLKSTRQSEMNWMMNGMISNLFEDLPQVTIQIYVYLHMEEASIATLVSLSTSVFALLIGLMTRLLICLMRNVVRKAVRIGKDDANDDDDDDDDDKGMSIMRSDAVELVESGDVVNNSGVGVGGSSGGSKAYRMSNNVKHASKASKANQKKLKSAAAFYEDESSDFTGGSTILASSSMQQKTRESNHNDDKSGFDNGDDDGGTSSDSDADIDIEKGETGDDATAAAKSGDDDDSAGSVDEFMHGGIGDAWNAVSRASASQSPKTETKTKTKTNKSISENGDGGAAGDVAATEAADNAKAAAGKAAAAEKAAAEKAAAEQAAAEKTAAKKAVADKVAAAKIAAEKAASAKVAAEKEKAAAANTQAAKESTTETPAAAEKAASASDDGDSDEWDMPPPPIEPTPPAATTTAATAATATAVVPKQAAAAALNPALFGSFVDIG